MDTGYHHHLQTSGFNQRAISFESSPRDSKSEMIMIGDFSGHMNFSGNSSIVNSSSTFTGIGNSCESLVVDSVPELKNRAGLAVEWSVEEQYKLEEAIPKYVFVFVIYKYILFSFNVYI